MRPSPTWRGVLATAFLATFAPALLAQSVFERLANPGPLAKAHAKLEKTCEACHAPFSKEGQTKLCLDCHKDIASDIGQGRGLHGKHPETKSMQCRSCHSDHLGRDADIVGFDVETFQHALTDYPLGGAHTAARCDDCHPAGKKFSQAPSDCMSCHQKDDMHKGALGTQCSSCHDEKAWQPTKPFDHANTAYPLEGAHKDVACSGCHAGERYKGIATDCHSCHQIQDIHQGTFGAKCETCHGVDHWTVARFNHDKETEFPLHGAHAKVACATCHKGDAAATKLGTTCAACHGASDPHKGELGSDCGQCHNETSWRKKVAFDHNQTQFPLAGKHRSVACEACHVSDTFKDAPLACSSCHEDKVHHGSLGTKCDTCHDADAWSHWHFDHDRETRYPLTGMHATVRCDACHSTAALTPPSSTPTACVSCHKGRDVHFGLLGSNCATCHSTKTWSLNPL